MENILLSYPRSGNHLVRFFIELISEIPTYGCKETKKDIEIYKNIFPEKVPFNISDFDKKDCYFKYHSPPSQKIHSNKLILIIRNPKEVLLSQNNYKLNIKGKWDSYKIYFKNIDYYNNHNGKKLLLYYEDIIKNKIHFINILYEFLDVNNIEKKNYVLSNIDKLYDLSSKGKKRAWNGINTSSIDYYYKKIPKCIKKRFNNYINDKFKKYPFLNEKYNINNSYSELEGKWCIHKKELVSDMNTLLTINRMDIIVNLIYCTFYDKKIKSNFAHNLYIKQKKSEKGENLSEYSKTYQERGVSHKNGEKDWIEKLNDLIESIKNNQFIWKDNIRAIDMITINENSNLLVRGAHRVAIHYYFKKNIYAAFNNELHHIHKCEKLNEQEYEYTFNEFINLKKNTSVYILFPKYNNKKNDSFITNKINEDKEISLLYKKKFKLNERGFIYFLIVLYQIHDINGVGNLNYNVIRNKLLNSFDDNDITAYFVEIKCNKKYVINFKKNIVREYIDHKNNHFSFHVTDNHEETENVSRFVLNNNNIFFANNNFIDKFNTEYPSLNDIKNTKINKKIDVNKIIKDVYIDLKDYCIVGSTILALFGIRKNKDIDIVFHNNFSNGKYDNHNNYFLQFLNTEPDEIIFNPNNYMYFFNIKCITPKLYLEFKRQRYNRTKDDKDKLDIEDIERLIDPICKTDPNVNPIIPKVFHLTNKTLNYEIVKRIDIIKQFYPDFSVKFYDDANCINFLKENYSNKHVETFKKIKGQHKAYFFRYCILYKIGGYYIDNDNIINQNISKLINGYDFVSCIYIGKNIAYKNCKYNKKHIHQSFIACKKNNTILEHLINHMIENPEPRITSYSPLKYHYYVRYFYIYLLKILDKKELCPNTVYNYKNQNLYFLDKNSNDINNTLQLSNNSIKNSNDINNTLQLSNNSIKNKLNYLIISFCNYDYVNLAKIWLEELAKLNITNYVIISADQKTYEHLKSKNIITELRNYDKRESFWVYRIKVIQSFLEKNPNNYLVHSDLDAIWKKNICEELLSENNNIDLFFSEGTIYPKEHLKTHKFVLCCGFFCIKSKEKTIKFFNKYINNLIKIKDDQKAINLELIDTKWNTKNNDPKYLPNKKYVYYENDVNGYNPKFDINILLISFNKIQREFLDNNGYIYHILSPSICSKKIDLFKKLKII